MQEKEEIIKYALHLADNALILGHRNSEWCGHGPVLEEDIALTNIALDLVGQSRHFYQYAAQLSGDHATEDSLAFLRDSREFRNCLLAELPNSHWGTTILRQFFFSTYQYLLYGRLQNSKESMLSAIAAKGLKEATYHLRWSSEWVVRLGDGTEESHMKMEEAIEELWTYTGELTEASNFESFLAESDLAVNPKDLKIPWQSKIEEVFREARLSLPEPGYWMQTGGKSGLHTEHLGHLLAEMQVLQRTYPNATW